MAGEEREVVDRIFQPLGDSSRSDSDAPTTAKPKRMGNRHSRTSGVSVRLSQTELDLMHQRASERGLKMTEYILVSTIYSEQSNYVELRKVLEQIVRELNHQGNNLNQVAKKLNSLDRGTVVHDDLSRQVSECLAVHKSFLEEFKSLVQDAHLHRTDDPK